MNVSPSSSTSPPRKRSSAIRTAAIVYALAALVLWVWYPPSPRLVIQAGATAAFGGFTPDGKKMLTNYQPGWRLWDVHTGEMGPYMVEQRAGDPVGFTPDGQRFYVGSRYYSTETGQVLPEKRYVEPGWNAGLHAVDIDSPDGLSIAHTPFERTIVADAYSGKERFQVPGGSAVVFTPDGKTLIAAVTLPVKADENTNGPRRWAMNFFDATTGSHERMLAEQDGFVNRMAISSDGKKLALAVWQETPEQKSQMGVQIWDVAAGKREQTLAMKGEEVSNLSSLRLLADGSVVSLAGTWGLGAATWDLTVPAPDNFFGATGTSLSFTALSADGRLIAIWDDKAKELRVQRLGTGKREIVSRRSYAKNVSCWPQAFAGDERLIVHVSHGAGGDRTTMGILGKILDDLNRRLGGRTEYEVIEPLSGRLLGKVPCVKDAPTAGISPDGRTLVTHENKLKLRDRFTLWDVPTPTPWLAIFGLALLPAVAVGFLLRGRKRSQQQKNLT